MTNTNDICGTCTACCKLLGIGDTLRGEPFKKPAGVWCQHCDIGKGCKIYDERPTVCREFQCLYLQGVLTGNIDNDNLRPDRCGVVFSPTTDPNIIAASVDRHKSDAWRRGEAFKLILTMCRAGLLVTVSTGPTEKKLTLKRYRGGRIAVEEMDFTPADEKGIQWSVEGSDRFVEFLT